MVVSDYHCRASGRPRPGSRGDAGSEHRSSLSRAGWEEAAVEVMKAGAYDFLTKDNLAGCA